MTIMSEKLKGQVAQAVTNSIASFLDETAKQVADSLAVGLKSAAAGIRRELVETLGSKGAPSKDELLKSLQLKTVAQLSSLIGADEPKLGPPGPNDKAPDVGGYVGAKPKRKTSRFKKAGKDYVRGETALLWAIVAQEAAQLTHDTGGSWGFNSWEVILILGQLHREAEELGITRRVGRAVGAWSPHFSKYGSYFANRVDPKPFIQAQGVAPMHRRGKPPVIYQIHDRASCIAWIARNEAQVVKRNPKLDILAIRRMAKKLLASERGLLKVTV
jgi:hypothetical protein